VRRGRAPPPRTTARGDKTRTALGRTFLNLFSRESHLTSSVDSAQTPASALQPNLALRTRSFIVSILASSSDRKTDNSLIFALVIASCSRSI
jgi:hypothetical protein